KLHTQDNVRRSLAALGMTWADNNLITLTKPLHNFRTVNCRMKTDKYLNPLNWFAGISALIFKIRMRPLYSLFRQGCDKEGGQISVGLT
ncbi:hypothetical protein, partial [Daejeonella sp.]|uniref:hypothetical protein n=1 Tax=Daejeonella sp. TaxID=2805397 RepID=UPI0030C497AF